MIIRTAENTYRKGIASLRNGDHMEAMAFFEAALRLDRKRNPETPSMKYLSYFGLCLALNTTQKRHAVEICRQAAESEFYNPDLFMNLGKVSILQGDRQLAFEAVRRGLTLDNRHSGLKKEAHRLGVRRPATFSFLSRGNVLNRIAGKIRQQMAAQS